MTYSKAEAEIIRFDSRPEFMAWSGSSAGQSQAEAAAVGQPEIQAELRKGNRTHVESSIYDPLSGSWTVTVTCYNNGGNETLSKTYIFDKDGNLI